MQDPKLKLVVGQTYGNRLEADLAKNALEAAGIPAMLQADTAGGMREHLSGVGFKILVREEDEAAAREVLMPPAGTLLNESGQSLDADFQPGRDDLASWRRFT